MNPMRIVIDFETCPDGLPQQALALVRELAADGAKELWLALSSRAGEAAPQLRHALEGVVPRERICVYTAPEKADEELSQLLRRHFLLSLQPNVVLTPNDETPLPSDFPCDVSEGTVPTGLSPAFLSADHGKGRGQSRRDSPLPLPRLAYISPLPPMKSGIADYSAELLPELARYYDITLIVEQDEVADTRIAQFARHPVEWFEDHAADFDRVVYHFGNSHAHKHMFQLLRRHPGIVVLHDFYLSGVLSNLQREGYLPQAFSNALYESHGYPALIERLRIGRDPAVWKYPANKGVLDNADGIIVHSPFSVELARQWYGPEAAQDWRIVPLLRGKPDTHAHDDVRTSARTRLGLAPDDYVICSFGVLGPIKANEELFDAFMASPLAKDPRCKLVFVGEQDTNEYGQNLDHKIRTGGAARGVSVTGFVDAMTYADYLAACDCAVQLRTMTRGETSASVLDCLLYGIPTVVNAHGSTASIDPQLVVMLPDRFEVRELEAALTKLHGDSAMRRGLSERAVAHMKAEHAPDRVGEIYRDTIEHFAENGRFARYRRLLDDVVRHAPPAPQAVAPLAAAIALNQPPQAPRQMLVDVSAVAQSDIKTGIQRVVRSVVQDLLANPPAGYRVEPVFTTGANRGYQYARKYTLGAIGEQSMALEDAPVELRAGDIFLGLDLFSNGTTQNQQCLLAMRNLGVHVYFVVYDLLPVLRPEVFPYGTEGYFTEFLETVSTVSDGVVCISRSVADELCEWIATHRPYRDPALQVGYFHLGADIDASVPTAGLPDNAQQVFDAVRGRPSFLMVGTVEPRKGHAQALAAFERLWEQGVDANLVIVGKQGWMVDKLCDRLAAHPEKNRRLFWLPGVSDEMLLKLYAMSSALLAPSEGEGFGLPLIEAAQHGIPIIARRLPVFSEIAGEHAYYFDGMQAQDLAGAITAWLDLKRGPGVPESTGMRWLTWSESTRELLASIVDGKWYRTAPGGKA